MKPVQFTKAFFFSKGSVFRSTSLSISEKTSIPLHTHDFAEVFWVETGHGIHVINGQRVPLTAGTLVAIRPADCHTFEAIPGTAGLKMINVSVSCDILETLRARYFPAATAYFWATTVLPYTVQLDDQQQQRLRAWEAILGYQWASRFIIEHFLLELLTGCQSYPRSTASAPAWLQKAMEAVRKPQYFTGGTRAFARLAGRCPVHVNRALRQYFGLTTTEMVNRARMEYAARELSNSSKKIIDVGLECGFQSLGHFYKVFRQYYGLSPRNYRQRSNAPMFSGR